MNPEQIRLELIRLLTPQLGGDAEHVIKAAKAMEGYIFATDAGAEERLEAIRNMVA